MGRHTNVVNRAIQSGTVTVTTTASPIGTSGIGPTSGQLTYGIDVHAFQHVGSGLSDITPAITAYTVPTPRVYRVVVSLAGGTDEFDWYFKESRGPTSDLSPSNSGWSLGATGVAMTGSAQTLNEGVTVTFAATTGHTLNDEWRLTAQRPELHDQIITCHFMNLDGTLKISLSTNPNVTQDATATGGWIILPEAVLSLNWNKGDLNRLYFVGTDNTVMRIWAEGIG